jgi:hypothetical protein
LARFAAVAGDDLNFTGKLHCFLNPCGTRFKDLIPYFGLESADEHCVHNQQLHVIDASFHEGLSLNNCKFKAFGSSAVMDRHMVRFHEKGVAEHFRDPVVDLHRFVQFLTQVMEAGTQSTSHKFCRVGSKKFPLDVSPVVFIETGNIVERV